VNVYALSPARLFDHELSPLERPAANSMGRMHGVGEHHLVVGQGTHEIFIARDESFLLFFVELARDNVRLVIFKTQPMQQCDQPRTAFVNETELLFNPNADMARRARQRCAGKDLQRAFLRGDQKARAPMSKLLSVRPETFSRIAQLS
jgi:hypothetical protein